MSEIGYSPRMAKEQLQTLRRKLQALDSYIFSDIHAADIKHSEIGQSVMDHLFEAQKALDKLEVKI